MIPIGDLAADRAPTWQLGRLSSEGKAAAGWAESCSTWASQLLPSPTRASRRLYPIARRWVMSPYSRSAGDGLVDRRTRQTLRPTRVHRWPHNSASHHLGTLHDVRLPHRPIWTLRRQWVKLQRGALLAHGRSGPDHAERLHGRVPPPAPTVSAFFVAASTFSSSSQSTPPRLLWD
ncbi:hypothetical protein OPV22_033009 [Ensete ventricosum]|uniref:Uncharacterized protein n=1 Tax=Ensete ventricosum TaxID=4639 RepID=A0AAV8PZZ2_ENSVE|nr:hypothetical protein OPV22_033009 [Ensete ventricosum]